MTAKNNQKVEPRILKGFRDFLPDQARKRQYAIGIIRRTFELYGFEPLETPAIEYEDILLGKYGPDADKLLYRFEDLGKRKIALRYDQTVPLARVIAQYENKSSRSGELKILKKEDFGNFFNVISILSVLHHIWQMSKS